MRIETANQVNGRATGALFFSAFGALWVFLGLYVREVLTPWTGAIAALCLIALAIGAIVLKREASRLPQVADNPRTGRVFLWTNVAQWVAIAVVIQAANHMHMEAYLMNAITLIVGLHMFPLAKAFRYRPHYVTGAALTLWAVVAAGLFPREHLQGPTCLGTGAILWGSAAAGLFLAFHGMRVRDEGVGRSTLIAGE